MWFNALMTLAIRLRERYLVYSGYGVTEERRLDGDMQNLRELPHFILTDNVNLRVSSLPGTPAVTRWQPVPHFGMTRPSLILISGEQWALSVDVGPATELMIAFGRALRRISSDGLYLLIRAAHAEIIRVHVTNDDAAELREIRIGLGYLTPGRTDVVISVDPGPKGDPSADWLAISELVIGPRQDIPLLRARAFHDLRVRNEINHFESVYDHKLFDGRKRQIQSATATRLASKNPKATVEPQPDISTMQPLDGEDVFHFAHRMLSHGIRGKAPNFHQRLADLAAHGDLRIASFCAGAAQVEAALIRSTDKPVHLTLVDINQGLLNQAAAAMPEHCTVQTVVQDVNSLSLGAEEFDVAIFVSGVHHVVELEHVWREIQNALRPGGEVWLIGEQVGKNGNRLDSEALTEANRVFRMLPERFRRNALTSEIDWEISNKDCAEATFEGIRSEDIESTLGRHFLPIDVYKRNCFLWRLTNQVYFDNYDLSREEDVQAAKSLVSAELDYFFSGGRPTELHGIYRRNG